jgi:hypothetical protein
MAAECPIQLAEQRGAELRVAGQTGVIGGQASQRGEPELLTGGDARGTVTGEHGRVTAESAGAPPGLAWMTNAAVPIN